MWRCKFELKPNWAKSADYSHGGGKKIPDQIKQISDMNIKQQTDVKSWHIWLKFSDWNVQSDRHKLHKSHDKLYIFVKSASPIK